MALTTALSELLSALSDHLPQFVRLSVSESASKRSWRVYRSSNAIRALHDAVRMKFVTDVATKRTLYLVASSNQATVQPYAASQLCHGHSDDMAALEPPPVVRRKADRPTSSTSPCSTVAPAKFGAFARDCDGYFEDLSHFEFVETSDRFLDFIEGPFACRPLQPSVGHCPPDLHVQYGGYHQGIAGYRFQVQSSSLGCGWYVWRGKCDCENLLDFAKQDPLLFAHCSTDLSRRLPSAEHARRQADMAVAGSSIAEVVNRLLACMVPPYPAAMLAFLRLGEAIEAHQLSE